MIFVGLWGFRYFFDKFAETRFIANRSFRGPDNIITKWDEACYFGGRGRVDFEDMEHI